MRGLTTSPGSEPSLVAAFSLEAVEQSLLDAVDHVADTILGSHPWAITQQASVQTRHFEPKREPVFVTFREPHHEPDPANS